MRSRGAPVSRATCTCGGPYGGPSHASPGVARPVPALLQVLAKHAGRIPETAHSRRLGAALAWAQAQQEAVERARWEAEEQERLAIERHQAEVRAKLEAEQRRKAEEARKEAEAAERRWVAEERARREEERRKEEARQCPGPCYTP